MRVCFDGLCFASRRPVVEEDNQTTILCGSSGSINPPPHATHLDGHTNPIVTQTTTPPTNHLQTQNNNNISNNNNHNSNINKTAATIHENSKMENENPSIMNMPANQYADFTGGNNNNNNLINNCYQAVNAAGVGMMDHQNTDVPTTDLNSDDNTNLLIKQSALIENHNNINNINNNNNLNNNNNVHNSNQIDMLGNLYISDNNLTLNLTPKEQQLLQILTERDQRIKELEDSLRQKNDEVAELKSHLDKFQSVFPFSRTRKTNNGGGPPNGGQRQRATGISAEPQSESSVLEMMKVTFPKYDKAER